MGRLIVIAVEPLYTSLDDLNKLGVSREFRGLLTDLTSTY